MSARPTVTVRCDWPSCYSELETYDGQVTKARAVAAEQGWTRVGGLDFCGKQEQRRYKYSHESPWSNHAGRTDHMPIVTAVPRRKGRVKLACSCGWEYVSPYNYDSDTALRSMIDYHWGKHVTEIEEAAEKARAAEQVAG